MLEGGANPDISDHYGYTTLKEAIWVKSLVSVDKLIRAGVDVNYSPSGYLTPLCLAAKYRQVDILKKLIKAGADLNVSAPTPLYVAAEVKDTCGLSLKN